MTKYTSERLFEMMHKVGGMPINETIDVNPIYEDNSGSQLPPGFSTTDFVPLEKDIELTPCPVTPTGDIDLNADDSEIDEDVREFEPEKMRKVSPEQIKKSFQHKAQAYLARKKQGIGAVGKVHSLTLKDIGNIKSVALKTKNPRTGKKYTEDEVGKKIIRVAWELLDFDIDKMRDILLTKPAPEDLLGQNKKMGKTNFYNISLPALKSLIYNVADNSWYVLRICPNAYKCINYCYAQLANYIMYDAPIRSKMQKLNYLINHWQDWRRDVIDQITALDTNKAEGEETVIRWHDAGDFFAAKYLQTAYDIAEATPNAIHYAYTKEVSMVRNVPNRPPNFEIKFSYGGHEDEKITSDDPRAYVAPASTFEKYLKPMPPDLTPDQKEEWGDNHGQWQFNDKDWEQIKYNIAREYKILTPDGHPDLSKILTHDEYVEILHDRKIPQERKYFVIGKPGDTDIPASRKDTMAIINLIHK